MRGIGGKNQISKDVFDFMISYLPFPRSQSLLNMLNFFPSVYFHRNAKKQNLKRILLEYDCKLEFQIRVVQGESFEQC